MIDLTNSSDRSLSSLSLSPVVPHAFRSISLRVLIQKTSIASPEYSRRAQAEAKTRGSQRVVARFMFHVSLLVKS
jgi:hypothetical protein